MWLTRFSIQRPIIVAMFFIALGVFGALSYNALGKNAQPNVAYPIVIVFAGYAGASPAEMERLVIKPIEDQIDGIEHLDQMTATAQDGVAVVVVQFKLGTDLDFAAIDVQRRVDTARIYMPADLDPPQVSKNGAQDAILTYAISSKTMTGPALADIVNDRVLAEIKHIPNVAGADLYGAAQREFEVYADPLRLMGTGATLADVASAIAQNNANVPGGRIDQPTIERDVSVHAEINSAGDIAAIPLDDPRRRAEGAQRRLGRDGRRRARRAARALAHQRRARAVHRHQPHDHRRRDRLDRARPPRDEEDRRQVPADQLQRAVRARRLHASLAQRRAAVAVRGDLPHRDRADAVPARVAQRGGRDDRDPVLAAGDVRRHAHHGPHAGQHLADGPLADHRDPGRRLDRRAGEHHPASRHGAVARRRGDQRAHRDRRRRDRDHAGRRRRVLAAGVPERLRRQVHAGVRHRRHRRDAVLAVRLVHAHADAGREVVDQAAFRRAAALSRLVPDRLRAAQRVVS